MRARVAAARVARLATVSMAGIPHLVPICFALVGDTVYTAVDHKPKRSPDLKRIDNAVATGRAALLVDDYTEDWTRLWWVRLDATAALVTDPALRSGGLDALAAKYPQYARRRPAGAVLHLDVTRWTAWAATT